MTKKELTILGTVFGVMASSAAFAAEHAVKRSEVPEAVLKAVAARYPRGEMRQFILEVEHGRAAYEVQLDLGGSRTELIVAPDGTIKVEERVITFGELPGVVQKGLAASRFGKAKVLRVERVTKAEKTDASTYEIVVDLHGKKHELVFDGAGKLLTTERADDEED